MKRIISWIILSILIIGIAIMLFITGRQHTLYIENKSNGEFIAPKEVSYIINGEKKKKIKANKKNMAIVKGREQEIKITYKDSEGNPVELEKKFKLGIVEDALISIPVLINGGENWIEEYREEQIIEPQYDETQNNSGENPGEQNSGIGEAPVQNNF